MKITRTQIGIALIAVYLAIFFITVLLAVFDNREGWGNFFPGVMTLPWSLILLIFLKFKIKLELVANTIILLGALLNAWCIYSYFKRSDRKQKPDK